MPKLQSSVVRGLRAHFNRKIGNLAVEALLAPKGRNLQVGRLERQVASQLSCEKWPAIEQDAFARAAACWRPSSECIMHPALAAYRWR